MKLAQTTARRIVLASRPRGRAALTDFRVEETDLPDPKSGEMLLRVEYLSLDPYMRGRMEDRQSYAPSVDIGEVMPAESVATVIASKHPDYNDGEAVLAFTGWCTHVLSDGSNVRKVDGSQTPVTTRLGVLGMPGFTAYTGLRLIGKPKPNETVVVAAASGPVGSLVGQLAKIAGARAVGIAGGPKKCLYLEEELGFDAAIDRRESNFAAALRSVCPNGIDVYFENVGGAIWQAVVSLLSQFARVPICGLIAQYNGANAGNTIDHLPATMRAILSKSLTLRGYINYEFTKDFYDDFLRDVTQGICDGSIRYREDIVAGFENTPAAFLALLDGRNFGKVIVKLVENR
jgi:NADPH-dependent curcumin reductase CurA